MHKNNGFSLVELSIVLVILGLLTGGILGGQALMRAAELRSVTTEYQQYTTAIQTFRDKYFAFPGDMPNATVFWGGPPADCMNDPTTDGTTCNGDGDGIIDYDNTAHGSDNDYEGMRAWQHLANAGLINGTYTGADAVVSVGYSYVGGQNVPLSKLNQGIWSLWWLNAQYEWMPKQARHYLTVSKPRSDLRWHEALFSTEEAWNIDTKVDDGLPFQGRVQDMRDTSSTSYTPNCNTDNTDNAKYNLQFSGAACLMFMGF